MTRYIVKLYDELHHHNVRWLYAHGNGQWYKDVDSIDGATKFYAEEQAEEYVNKIRKNPGYMFFFPEIIKIDDDVLSPTKETYENLPRSV